MIRVVSGRVLKRLLCDLSLLTDTGLLRATTNVHYDEIDHKVRRLTVQGGPKKRDHKLTTIILCQILTDFETLFTCASGQHTAKRRRKCTDNLVLACIFAKYSPILIFFTHRLSNKLFAVGFLISVSFNCKFTKESVEI